MGEGKLKQVDGSVAGAWIEPRLAGFGGRVNQQVPEVFAAYARVFHPAGDEQGAPVSWAEVARRLGTTAHREMQWHAIVGTRDYTNFHGSRWDGDNPVTGELDDASLAALCAILARHTRTPEDCFFGLTTISGGVAASYPDAPVLSQPYRDWVVLSGPISAYDEIEIEGGFTQRLFFRATAEGEGGGGESPDLEAFERRVRHQAPSLIWPEDRAWFVASEYDFDSTLVGGSRELIEAILAAPELEAWEVDPEVWLTCDADRVNPVPEGPRWVDSQ